MTGIDPGAWCFLRMNTLGGVACEGGARIANCCHGGSARNLKRPNLKVGPLPITDEMPTRRSGLEPATTSWRATGPCEPRANPRSRAAAASSASGTRCTRHFPAGDIARCAGGAHPLKAAAEECCSGDLPNRVSSCKQVARDAERDAPAGGSLPLFGEPQPVKVAPRERSQRSLSTDGIPNSRHVCPSAASGEREVADVGARRHAVQPARAYAVAVRPDRSQHR
jgi:hypothetical protein